MQLHQHPLFHEVKPYISHAHDDDRARQVRFEARGMPYPLQAKAKGIAINCAACGKVVYPFRPRAGQRGGIYVRVTCGGPSCYRGGPARLAVIALEAALGDPPTSPQVRMF